MVTTALALLLWRFGRPISSAKATACMMLAWRDWSAAPVRLIR